MESTIKNSSSYELERGKPMPSKNHSIIQYNIIKAFVLKYDAIYQALPELSLNINGNEKIPDVAICKPLQFLAEQDEIKVNNPPLCAIEICSPTQRISDLTSKSNIYFEFGVKSYWLIIPELRAVFVYQSPQKYEVFANEELLTDSQLKVEIELKMLFGKAGGEGKNEGE